MASKDRSGKVRSARRIRIAYAKQRDEIRPAVQARYSMSTIASAVIGFGEVATLAITAVPTKHNADAARSAHQREIP
jgi:hypothetical protein